MKESVGASAGAPGACPALQASSFTALQSTERQACRRWTALPRAELLAAQTTVSWTAARPLFQLLVAYAIAEQESLGEKPAELVSF